MIRGRRIIRVAAAGLISIAQVLATSQSSLANTAAVQNAAGIQVESSASDGLFVVTFITPEGSIYVNFPDDISAGDTISGTIATEPTGKNDAERAPNRNELNGYVIELAQQQTTVGDKTFTRQIPGRIGMKEKVLVLLRRGLTVAETAIPISPTPLSLPALFTLPTGGQQGRSIQIKGPCNGTFSPQDYMKMGGTTLPPAAESPRSLILRNDAEFLGPTTLVGVENGQTIQCPFRNIGVNLSAPKLNLLRGDTTSLHVVVLGLSGISGDLPMDLDDTTPSVVTMSGGDKQHLTIHATEVRANGTYSTDRTLTGIMAGGFGVTATVRWTDVCMPERSAGPRNPGGKGPARAALDEGRVQLAHYKYYAALGPLTEALKTYKSHGDQNGVGVASDALGDLYLQEGQYVTAVRYFRSAREAFLADKETVNASLILSKIGETYLLLEDVAGAKAVFAQFGPPIANQPTASDSDQHKAFFAYSRNKLGEGRADYLLGQFDAAEADFKNLLAVASSPQSTRYKEATRFRIAAATNLGDVYYKKGDFSSARLRFNEAIQFASRSSRAGLDWAAKAGLGRTLWAMARGMETSSLRTTPVGRAAHAVAQTRNPETLPQLQTDAMDAYRDSLAEIESIIEGSIRGGEARSSFLETTSHVYDEASSVGAELALARKATDPTASSGVSLNFTAESFQITERGRARSLLDVLADGHAEVSAGVPPELVKLRGENLANQELIEVQLTGVSITGESPTQPVAALEAELERLANEFESIESRINSSSPRYASQVQTRSLTIHEVQQQVLDDRSALLEYSLGENGSYLWVITRERASLFKLPGAAVMDKLAMNLRGQLIPSKLQRRIAGIDVAAREQRRSLDLGADTGPPAENTTEFANASRALYNTVIAPAAAAIGARRMIVVADGAMNFIPFEALVTTDRGGDYSSLDYLVMKNEVSYAPSASVVAAIRGNNRNSGRNILLVADPVFSANDTRLKNSAAVAGDRVEATRGLGLDSGAGDVTGHAPGTSLQPEAPRLVGTRTEAEQISRLARIAGVQPDMWLDLSANEAELKNRDIANYRVLHIATHGFLDADRPQFSGLVLSLVGNRNNDDGFLRTSEIFNLKLGSPLVMLSACESGLGKLKHGEGVIGLTRAFIYAGAPNVGVTLWSVADKPTAELMTDFYKRLLGSNSSPASSLRDAQIAMINGKKYSAPFYWAPFVLVGEGK